MIMDSVKCTQLCRIRESTHCSSQCGGWIVSFNCQAISKRIWMQVLWNKELLIVAIWMNYKYFLDALSIPFWSKPRSLIWIPFTEFNCMLPFQKLIYIVQLRLIPIIVPSRKHKYTCTIFAILSSVFKENW